ncbi:hypothetical protein ABZ135_38360 [Streptomyces sp. NPDC006339]|uniref:hypothetical protein n=1 Tax=Streptomyces sp. NPDC006339 TaxID=3156755 RepID=UPI0033BEB276
MPSRFEYERAIRASQLKPPSRHLGLTIATWADARTGIIPDRFQPSLTTLEKATGLSRATVRTHLDHLETGGWLSRDRPSVVKARSEGETTKYGLRIPKSAFVSAEDSAEGRAGAALLEEGVGQELPHPGAGAALPVGQELPSGRAGAALISSRSNYNGPEVPPTAALPDQMLTKWWEQYGHTTAQNKTTIRRAIADALTNGLAPATLWQALTRLGDLAKPVTGGTLQFALSELRQAAPGAEVVPLRAGAQQQTDDLFDRAMARARARMQESM